MILTANLVGWSRSNHTDFVRAGAELSEPQKQRMQEINGELAMLQTTFAQNVLSEVNDSAVVVDTRAELAGLSEAQLASAAAAATARNLAGRYVIALLNTSGQPSLSSLESRELRERIARTSLARGSRGGEFDNRDVVTRIARLRAERSVLLGYPHHAGYILEEQTAQTVEAVNERLASLVPPAVANAKREAADLQAAAAAEGARLDIASWDWSFYTEKVRARRYDFDASELRPYFEMNNVLGKRRVFRREPALRVELQGATRAARLPSGRSRLGGLRRGTTRRWVCSWPITTHAPRSAAGPGWTRMARSHGSSGRVRSSRTT